MSKMKLKALLYCTKAQPYITRGSSGKVYPSCVISDGIQEWHLNGKIAAECDYEVEKTTSKNLVDYEKASCVDRVSMLKYFKPCLIWDDKFETLLKTFGDLTLGYAIHIKNLHIFDKPKELSEYYGLIPKKINDFNGSCYVNVSIDNAPKNMMYAIDDNDNEYIIISVSPQEMCRIANKEQTVLVRKKVLKEMLK